MKTHFDEKGKIFTKVVKKAPIDVHIQTSNHLIVGKIHIRPEERAKDELDQSEMFIAVTDANIYDLSGTCVYRCGFLTVNRRHIVWLFQDADQKKVGEEL